MLHSFNRSQHSEIRLSDRVCVLVVGLTMLRAGARQ